MFAQAPRRVSGLGAAGKSNKALTASGGDAYHGTFVWRIEHFTRLKDLLKKRKITGLCIKSRRFSVGGCTCRLIVYPRGAPFAYLPKLLAGMVIALR